jgi:hypothetical protein
MQTTLPGQAKAKQGKIIRMSTTNDRIDSFLLSIRFMTIFLAAWFRQLSMNEFPVVFIQPFSPNQRR